MASSENQKVINVDPEELNHAIIVDPLNGGVLKIIFDLVRKHLLKKAALAAFSYLFIRRYARLHIDLPFKSH